MHKVLGFLLLAAFALISANNVDYTHYCGLPEYPAELPSIPEIVDNEVTDYNSMFLFHRHGDRSTLTDGCFKNFPPRVYTECDTSVGNIPNAVSAIRPHDVPIAFNLQTAEDANTLRGNCFSGQLTKRGFLMSYNNGLRFGSYLNKTFTQTRHFFNPAASITMRSTDVHRTIETAESFLTGVIDGSETQRLAKNLAPLYMADVSTDYIRLGSNMCKTSDYIKEAYAADKWVAYKKNVIDPLEEEIASALGEKSVDYQKVFDCMMINVCLKTPNPEPITEDLVKRATAASTEYWLHGFGYDQVRSSKVFTGPLLYKLLAQLTSVYTKTEADPKLHVTSGHDFGPMMNLASALGYLEVMPYWPPYHSTIAIEMVTRRDAVGSYIRFMWQGVVVKPRFCANEYVGELCPTKTVLAYLAERIPSKTDCPTMPFDNNTFQKIIQEAKEKQTKQTYKGASIAALELALQPVLKENFHATLMPQEQAVKKMTDEERWMQASLNL